jgi:hypothetical protein
MHPFVRSREAHKLLCALVKLSPKSKISRFCLYLTNFESLTFMGSKISYFWNVFWKQDVTVESCNKSEIPESNPRRGILDLCVRGVWTLVTKVRFQNPTQRAESLSCVSKVCAPHGMGPLSFWFFQNLFCWALGKSFE